MICGFTTGRRKAHGRSSATNTDPGQAIQIVYDYAWANDSRTLIVNLGTETILVDSFVNINK